MEYALLKKEEIKKAADELVELHIDSQPEWGETISQEVKDIWLAFDGKRAAEHAIITVKKQIEEAEEWFMYSDFNESTSYVGALTRIEELKALLKELESRIK